MAQSYLNVLMTMASIDRLFHHGKLLENMQPIHLNHLPIVGDAEELQEVLGIDQRFKFFKRSLHDPLQSTHSPVSSHFWKLLNHLRPGGHQLFPFQGQLLQTVEAEAVDISEILIHHDQPTGDEDDPPEPLAEIGR